MNLTAVSVLVFIAALATLALAAFYPGPTFIFIAMLLIGLLVMLQTFRILVDNDDYKPLDEG
jgi:fatty acid desaturase